MGVAEINPWRVPKCGSRPSAPVARSSEKRAALSEPPREGEVDSLFLSFRQAGMVALPVSLIGPFEMFFTPEGGWSDKLPQVTGI